MYGDEFPRKISLLQSVKLAVVLQLVRDNQFCIQTTIVSARATKFQEESIAKAVKITLSSNQFQNLISQTAISNLCNLAGLSLTIEKKLP